jgi:hypothetical protein
MDDLVSELRIDIKTLENRFGEAGDHIVIKEKEIEQLRIEREGWHTDM